MIRTIAIFAVILIAIVAFLLPRSHHDSDPVRVDYSNELNLVQHRAPFHVLAPTNLPATWDPTHVTIEVPQKGTKITTFDVGFYVAENDTYVRSRQSDDPALVKTALGAKSAQHGTTVIEGQSWQKWADNAGEPALVRPTADGSTIVLSGKGSDSTLASQLAVLAGDLR